jgi:hypothetical protein
MTAQASRFPFSLDPLIAEAKRRARRRHSLLAWLLVLIAAGTGVAVVSTHPSASTAGTNVSTLAAHWHATQTCHNGGIAIVPAMQVVGSVSGRMQVSMSFATADSIAQRTGPQEFQPAGTHSGTARTVPCNVAYNAAGVAANTWSVGHRQQFAIKAGWAGYAAGPIFRFRCVLRGDGSRTLAGTCVHTANGQAGAVRVRFRIQRGADTS